MVPLKHLSIFLETLEMPLINCETNFMLTWSNICIISNPVANQNTQFAIQNIIFHLQLYQDNAKLLQKLKSGGKRTINLNKYQ